MVGIIFSFIQASIPIPVLTTYNKEGTYANESYLNYKCRH